MTIIQVFLCVLFLPFTCLHSNESDQQLFDQAEKLLAAGLYQESLPLYCQIKEPRLVSQAQYKKSCIQFQQGDSAGALQTLCSLTDSELSDAEKDEKVWLMAMCYKNLRDYPQEAALLISHPFKTVTDEILYERALVHFHLQEYEKAHALFACLSASTKNADLNNRAQLYLARIALIGQLPQEAEKILKSIAIEYPPTATMEQSFLQGQTAFLLGRYAKAGQYFSQALPDKSPELMPWYREVLYHQAWIYVKLAEEDLTTEIEKKKYLQKAQHFFQKLMKSPHGEREVLGLAYAYLASSRLLDEPGGNKLAAEVLSTWTDYSDEARPYALFLAAEAADDLVAKKKGYQTIAEADISAAVQAQSRYLLAVNTYEKALQTHSAKMHHIAAQEFECARQKLQSVDEGLAAICLKMQAQSLWEEGTQESRIDALSVLQTALEGHYSDDIYWQYINYARCLTLDKPPIKVLQRIERALLQQISQDKTPEKALDLAIFYFNSQQYLQAAEAFLFFVQEWPLCSEAPKALFQASLALENLSGRQGECHECRRRIYTQYPSSALAAQAYFMVYSYQDYLQGDKKAIRHLNDFISHYPSSPFTINANYLLGLDAKRDRRTPEGKLWRKKNLNQSLEAFSAVEATFDQMVKEDKIPSVDFGYFQQIRNRALFERGLIYFETAKESIGAKQEIYLQYAIDAFKQLKNKMELVDSLLINSLTEEGTFSLLHQESLYWLALTYLQSQDEENAQLVMQNMLTKYQKALITSNYYLSRILAEQGIAYHRQEKYDEAFETLLKAEEASKGKYLSVDEKLELWILQSSCCEWSGHIENAILILSKVINDDSVSPLRLKAMWLRAGLYEKLERPDLARRQLESVAKMRGEWAEKAKKRLEDYYAIP